MTKLQSIIVPVLRGAWIWTRPTTTDLATNNLAAHNTSYGAPLLNCDSKDIIPHQYRVRLKPGYNTEGHKHFLADGGYHVQFLNRATGPGGWSYDSWLYEDTLAAVRSDPDVKQVECGSVKPKYMTDFGDDFIIID